MKFAATILAVATYAATANAAACPPGETLKLIGLAFEPSLPQCQTDSKFTFIPPSGVPTQEQVDLMCASDSCHKTIAALQKLNPSDCDLTFSNGVTLNIKKLLDTLVPTCGLNSRAIHLNAAPACPEGEDAKLLQLAFEPSLPQCQEDSHFTFIPPQDVPNQEQVDLMCSSDACHSTLTALVNLKPLDCVQTFSNGVSLNVKQLLDDLQSICALRR